MNRDRFTIARCSPDMPTQVFAATGCFKQCAACRDRSIFFLTCCKFFIFLHAMRLLTFIIGCYVLGLSFLPCGDRLECDIKAPVSISSAAGHDDHRHSEEHCTPFCSCSCCASSVSTRAISQIDVTQSMPLTRYYSIYHPSFSPAPCFGIWQPPKIS